MWFLIQVPSPACFHPVESHMVPMAWAGLRVKHEHHTAQSHSPKLRRGLRCLDQFGRPPRRGALWWSPVSRLGLSEAPGS